MKLIKIKSFYKIIILIKLSYLKKNGGQKLCQILKKK